MVNKILSLMKEGRMRKTAVIFMIAIFMVVCSGDIYAQQITKVDKEKWDKLTPGQKKEFAERAKEARDTALGSVRDHDTVAKEAEKAKNKCEWVEKTALKVGIGLATVATGSTPIGIAAGIAAVEAVDPVLNSVNKNKSGN